MIPHSERAGLKALSSGCLRVSFLNDSSDFSFSAIPSAGASKAKATWGQLNAEETMHKSVALEKPANVNLKFIDVTFSATL